MLKKERKSKRHACGYYPFCFLLLRGQDVSQLLPARCPFIRLVSWVLSPIFYAARPQLRRRSQKKPDTRIFCCKIIASVPFRLYMPARVRSLQDNFSAVCTSSLIGYGSSFGPRTWTAIHALNLLLALSIRLHASSLLSRPIFVRFLICLRGAFSSEIVDFTDKVCYVYTSRFVCVNSRFNAPHFMPILRFAHMFCV